LKKKFKNFLPRRGPMKMFGSPARMFPRAPLWLRQASIYVIISVHASDIIFEHRVPQMVTE